MSVPSHLIEKELLHSALTSLGNIAALEIFFDIQKFSNDVQIFKNEWKLYNPRKPHIPRFGLSLHQSMAPFLESQISILLENTTGNMTVSHRLEMSSFPRLS